LAEAVARGARSALPLVLGARYGLSSKDFTPAMAKAVSDHLKEKEPRAGFTVGIIDDVCGTSLPVDASFDIEPPGVKRALFFGLGSDGTVGANKDSVKILAEDPGRYAQGYFVYDSHKSGAELSRPVFASSHCRRRLAAFGDPRRHPPAGGWRGGGDRRGIGL